MEMKNEKHRRVLRLLELIENVEKLIVVKRNDPEPLALDIEQYEELKARFVAELHGLLSEIGVPMAVAA